MAFVERLKRVLRRASRREFLLVARVVAIGLCLWIFFGVAEEMGEAEHAPLEARILRSLRKVDDPSQLIGPAWVGEAARDLSSLGGIVVTGLITALVTAYFALNRRWREAVFMLAAVGGGALLSETLKHAYARPRPMVVPYLDLVSDLSFPSGHSMTSAIVYLTLGALLSRAVSGWRNKVFIVSAGVLLSGLVGICRVMLGVHYPSDVLAGWAAGAGWALLCWMIAAETLHNSSDQAGPRTD
ncbi:MAG: phosphatase PAP2 family protein [Opitutaceae bacterium]